MGTNFDGHYAEAEITHFERVAAVERKLLEIIFAQNGNARDGVKIAAAEGIETRTFMHYEHRLLWLIAANCRDTQHAAHVARVAQKHHKIDVIDVAAFLDSWFWAPHEITRTAKLLIEVIAAEREAKLCAARYRALLAGDIKAAGGGK